MGKVSVEEPDARRGEWLNYLDRAEMRAMPLPTSLAHLKREISEKKWVKARQRAAGRTSRTKYRMPKRQRSDGAVAGSTKGLASRNYQVKAWLPYRTVSAPDHKSALSAVLVVLVPGSDSGAPLQGVS